MSGSSHPSSQLSVGGPPFDDPQQAMGYGGAGYPPGAAFQQPKRRVSSAIVVVTVIVVVGVVIGALWAAGVFGKGKLGADPTPSATTTGPSDDNTTGPTNDDTTGPTDNDTTQGNDPRDSLGQAGYQIKPVTRQGDTYILQDITIQILEYKVDTREQVKIANSRNYKGDEAYVDTKIRLTNSGSQRTYPSNHRFHVGDSSSNNLMFEAGGSFQEALTPSKCVEVGRPIEGWVYFSALDPPNAGKMKLYIHTPGGRYPKRVTYRCEGPIG